MNPWDIDISLMTQKFLDRLKELKNMDFRISGKIVLASSMLLKIKSTRLLDQDLTAFDTLLSSSDEEEVSEILEDSDSNLFYENDEKPKIIPRTPQPRKRKVSVFDLVEALEKALEVENRRKQYIVPEVKVGIPKKQKDIGLVIKDLYEKIASFFKKSTTTLSFSQLIPSDSKEDKVFTFIPLLHLDTQGKIDLKQKEHFGEISVLLNKK